MHPCSYKLTGILRQTMCNNRPVFTYGILGSINQTMILDVRSRAFESLIKRIAPYILHIPLP